MTREEAIKQLDTMWKMLTSAYDDIADSHVAAYTMAVDALKAQGTCEDAVSRQTLQKELALYPIDDITSEDEAGYNRAINDVQKMALHLPSAQPVLNRIKIEGLLEKIYSIQSVHLSVEGVLARKYYCKQLWIELFGSEDVPKWID